jgi:hypothetical protein
MEDKTILLKIELDTTSLTEGAKKAEENLKKLTPELEKIAKETGKNTLEYKKLNAEVKANQKTLTDNATALQKYEALQKSNNGSLKEMRSLLSASKVAYAELNKEERENAEVGGKLVKEMDALNEELLQAEKMYGTHTRNVGNYAGALTDLKAEIKSLKGQMATMDAGSEEYQKAASRAGELNDKLKEVNENTKANTGGTGFEKMSNNLGLVKDDLMNLDFAGVSEKMQQMAVISKGMTFKEVLGGLKNMGSALFNLGKAILTNPLFLMVGAIVAIGAALKMWNDSVNQNAVRAQQNHTKSIEDTIASLKKLDDNLKEIDELYIRQAELQGKSTKEVGDMRIKALKDEHKRELQIREENYKLLKSLGKELRLSDSKESGDAIREKIKATQDANEELFQKDLTFGTRLTNLKLEINNQIADENKANNEKIKSDNERAYAERLALARKLSDLQLGNLQLSHENERKAVEAQYKFLEESAAGNVDELLKIQEDKNKALNDLDKQEEEDSIKAIKERSKREIQDAEGNKSIIKEIETRTQLELDAVSQEFTTRKTERDNEYTKQVSENQKLRAENEVKTAEQIELIDAQLALAKAKGTKDEFVEWSRYRFARIRILEAERDREIALSKATGKDKEKIEKEYALKIQQLQDETFTNSQTNATKETELTKEQKKDLAIMAVNSAGQLADSLMQISRNQIQTEMNEEKEKFDSKQKALQDQLDAGVISQANFDSQMSVLASEYNAKEKELKEKQFKSNKASQLINATIATAVGVASALGTAPPLGIILAGIAGALGAAQIAIIASQPTPKFAKGGILNGASHSQGGIATPFGELEGGEAVINKNSTRLFSPLLSAINEAGGGVKFANGGILQPMTNAVDNQFSMQNTILQAMQSMPSPIVAVEEIVNAVGRRTAVVERANF